MDQPSLQRAYTLFIQNNQVVDSLSAFELELIQSIPIGRLFNTQIECCECSPECADCADRNGRRPHVAAAELECARDTERGYLVLHTGAQQLSVERHAEHELERHVVERDRPRALHALHVCRERQHRLRRRVRGSVLKCYQRDHHC